MSTPPEPTRDHLPDTPTARILRSTGGESPMRIEAATCKPKRYVVADPDAPNAPTCKPGRYIVVDPDDPDAPSCSGTRYVTVPDPKKVDLRALPGWAREAGEDLSQNFR